MNNKTIQEFTRKEINMKLNQCREEEINKFKRMYGNTEQSLEKVIDNIPADELDHSLTVVENTLEAYD